ncbi:MAG: TetR family transcriptional regulator [Sandaracinaceae bacterium]|nr:TetR family transcriptional regulator [Sandaracinaceae bacterium]
MTKDRATRSRQARGEETRNAVLAATLRVLAREGTRGVTHRAVAAEAGTSLRATTYYFASREELLRESLRYYAETAGSRLAHLAKPIAPDDDLTSVAAGLLTDIVLSDLTEDREGLISEYELVLHVGRQPDLEECYATWQGRLEAVLFAYAALAGSPSPKLDAQLVLAAVRGIEIASLASPSQPPAREAIFALFERLLTGLAAR